MVFCGCKCFISFGGLSRVRGNLDISIENPVVDALGQSISGVRFYCDFREYP